MERFEEALEHLDARVKIPERGYSTQYDKLCEMCRNIDLIEQELGISLEVLFKALKDGIYRFYEEPEDEEKHIYYLDPIICYDENKSCWLFFDDSTYNTYYLKDYGKTWALTREELE